MKKILILTAILLIYTAADSQQYWVNQPTGVNVFLNSLFFVNESTGYCVGNNSIFLHTINGGVNWYFRNIGSGVEALEKVFFVNDSMGFVLTGNKVMKTNNRG